MKKRAEPWCIPAPRQEKELAKKTKKKESVGRKKTEYLEAIRKGGIKKEKELSPVASLLMLDLVTWKSSFTSIEFWGLMLFGFKGESRRKIGNITFRHLFPEVLLQRAAKILKVLSLHCKNLDNIKNVEKKKVACSPAVWK